MMLVKMAWRNLWRNKRRTLLTLSSIAFAVLIAVVMRGFQLGTYDVMIGGMLKATSGYVQIQHKDFWDDKTIDNIIDFSPELESEIKSIPEVVQYYPRFQNFALASFGSHTKGVPVFGILPEREEDATAISEKLLEGDYLEEGDKSILISTDLARFLDCGIGDSVVLFGQGYHGVTAVGKYRVKGIFDYSYSQIGNAVVYLNLADAQDLYGAYGKVSTISLMLKDRDESRAVQEYINQKMAGGLLRAMNWEELNVKFLQTIQADNFSGKIMLSVLYLVIGFGIFGTMLMMAAERRREFSVMNAIGMKRHRIVLVVFYETLWLAILAVILGMLVSIPVNVYFYFNPLLFDGEIADMFAQYNIEPIMKMSGSPGYVINQAIVVFVICGVSLLGPVNLIKNLNIVNILRGR